MKRVSGQKRVYKVPMVLSALLLILAALVCAGGTAYADQAEPVHPNNGIPVVYLNIDESQGSIDDMMISPGHTDYCYGTMSIEVPEGFDHYCDMPDAVCQSLEGLEISLRGRGNSTWERSPKKPFKVKI